jgi:hypothetical protein
LIREFNVNAVRTHLDYSNWASNRLIAAASTLLPEELARDFGTADCKRAQHVGGYLRG